MGNKEENGSFLPMSSADASVPARQLLQNVTTEELVPRTRENGIANVRKDSQAETANTELLAVKDIAEEKRALLSERTLAFLIMKETSKLNSRKLDSSGTMVCAA